MCPELIKIGSLSIPGFMAAVVIAALLALGAGLHLARKTGLDRVEFLSYAIFASLSFWLASVLYRLFFTFLQSPQNVTDNLFQLKTLIEKSGTSVMGGILGAALFSWIYLKRVGLPLWDTLDIAFTAVPLAQSVGRIGCFLGGCCYGRVTDSTLGILFPGHAHAVHPTQLYESAMNLLNFVVLFIIFPRRKFKGQVFALFLMNYALIRFMVEFWRGDTYRGFVVRGPSPWTSLSIPQMMCFVLFSIGLLIHLRRRKQAIA